ncbi:MAG: hypothetical protein QGF28_01055 [Candidatus Thalassarchaeaceae archaeon]|jgi:hypothetical protein|nr:hypothetical protein [Euryarchaeota archaeon]MBV13608.1 hypothetical protein [Actinomycetota bacterium]MDP7091292.1 hypothetical protein [Candidatus Thalassarchaeaceae archaeon]MDP7257529.1 hypothetical protein [Candidatus Thalassarchaeaceae archaeon]MDP7445781.1 hypothetical protein [Candidatus Thalassarchaeaceae archaeon]|tara:strand:+ start:4779 stop:5243 length:465 start_codon:yes stop_codon:yes gene_type:complete
MRVAVWLLVGVFLLPSAAGCLYPPQAATCEEGTVLLEGECVTGYWVVIPIDFLSHDRFEVREGDLVRLVFDSNSFGHYIPDSFHLEGYGISEELSLEEVETVDFLADRPGEYSYWSTGLCRIDIPGAGVVEVDCTVFCGETENGRSGVFSVVGE